MVTASFVRGLPSVKAPQVDELMTAVGHIAFIAGGAARELALGRFAPPAQDIDVFLLAAGSLDECIRLIRGLGYPLFGHTEHAACFNPRSESDLPVQVILPDQDPLAQTAGSVESVLSHFSFTTEQFAIVQDGSCILGPEAIADTRERLLRLVNVNDPLAVACRATKYANKGYFMPMWEMHRLFADWDNKPTEWKREVAIAQAAGAGATR